MRRLERKNERPQVCLQKALHTEKNDGKKDKQKSAAQNAESANKALTFHIQT